ncbi:hypothetical protein [Rhodococcus opacus]|uniref:HK97 gp10 family phage protein n=1 Tax=Rhodococcus opacus TaxID=37919 RepID=A0A2S8JBZ1_RHOOP|nr:hypothetical protein [Rhodococcus opacus]PQP24162.1 hypothetical protein C5613_14880 [Rhodococcus opacus]
MLDVNIPAPNPGLAQLLLSPEMRSLMQERAEMAQALYRADVAKPTGRLARSARVETAIGGRNNDRWVSYLIVDAPYAASHEFGRGNKPRSTGQAVSVETAANDLNRALNMLGAF